MMLKTEEQKKKISNDAVCDYEEKVIFKVEEKANAEAEALRKKSEAKAEQIINSAKQQAEAEAEKIRKAQQRAKAEAEALKKKAEAEAEQIRNSAKQQAAAEAEKIRKAQHEAEEIKKKAEAEAKQVWKAQQLAKTQQQANQAQQQANQAQQRAKKRKGGTIVAIIAALCWGACIAIDRLFVIPLPCERLFYEIATIGIIIGLIVRKGMVVSLSSIAFVFIMAVRMKNWDGIYAYVLGILFILAYFVLLVMSIPLIAENVVNAVILFFLPSIFMLLILVIGLCDHFIGNTGFFYYVESSTLFYICNTIAMFLTGLWIKAKYY